MNTGTQIRGMERPVMRSAVISLSAESLPKTSRMPVSNAHGMVKMSEYGMT